MIINLFTQITDIMGGTMGHISLDTSYNEFSFGIDYTSKKPLYVDKESTFKELLSDLFDVTDGDISIKYVDMPNRYILGMAFAGALICTIYIRNIPEHAMREIVKIIL